MGAVARELLLALDSHPSAPSHAVDILVSTFEKAENGVEKDGEYESNQSLSKTLASLLIDEREHRVDVVSPKGFLSNKKSHTSNNDNINGHASKGALSTGRYGAAILSNVLTGTNVINDNVQLSAVLSALLEALRDDGVVIIRENIAGRSAHLIADLTKFLDVFVVEAAASRAENGNETDERRLLGFNFYAMNQVQASLLGGPANHLDVCWALAKRSADAADDAQLSTFREFLDRTQYTPDNVQSYEWIFGANFISPGGMSENRRVLKRFTSLRPGHRMLDIGVGIGGGARQAAKEFGVRVLGCDLSSNMIVHAFERNHRDKDARVEYQIADATRYRHPRDTFDAVFSRDCIQHIRDTAALFANIYEWLKPGGQMLITMYGKGGGELAPKFLGYVADRRYFLRSLDEFVEYAKRAGFVNIHAENMTGRLAEILRAEREKAQRNRADFEEKFSAQLFDKMMASWSDKLQFIADDNHNWLLIRGDKPHRAKDAQSDK